MKYLVEYWSYSYKTYELVDKDDFLAFSKNINDHPEKHNLYILLKIEDDEQAETILNVVEDVYSDGKSEGYYNGRDSI